MRKFLSWLFTPEPSLESLLRDFPRFKCRECGKTMRRMEDSPCSACVSRHVREAEEAAWRLEHKRIMDDVDAKFAELKTLLDQEPVNQGLSK